MKKRLIKGGLFNKMWCYLFGHNSREKTYTGETGPEDPMTGKAAMYYTWKNYDYCLRCGENQE